MNTYIKFLLTFALLFGAAPTAAAETTRRGMQLGVYNKARDLDVLAGWGANVARYTLHWTDFDAADASDEAGFNAWLDEALAHFDQLRPALESRGIQIVLALYTPPGGFVRRDAKANHRIFAEVWAQEAFVRAWQRIAHRYRDVPSIWGYDLINEPAEYSTPPAPLKNWSALAQEVVGRIREIEPTRRVLVSPIYGDPLRLNELGKLPFNDIVYTIHFYKPFLFLHQGVGTISYGRSYPTKKYNRRFLIKQLQPARNFQLQYNVPIFVGEFSTSRWAPQNSGFRYLRDLLNVYEANGWDWTYHEFRGSSPWNAELSSRLNDETPTPKPSNRLRLLLKMFARN